MFWATCSLAFFGFLRVSDFTCSGSFDPLVHLSISDVSFDTSGCLHLFIKTSKTDPFRRGVSLSIGASGKRICAVSAVRRYLQVRGNTPGPLFVLSRWLSANTGGGQLLAPCDFIQLGNTWYLLQSQFQDWRGDHSSVCGHPGSLN
jgi:hypothetical protein